MNRASSPWEITIAVEVLFASRTDTGVLIDCALAQEMWVSGTPPIPAGAPFALHLGVQGSNAADEALAVLRQWSDAGALVQATTSSTDPQLVLRHHADELVLIVGG